MNQIQISEAIKKLLQVVGVDKCNELLSKYDVDDKSFSGILKMRNPQTQKHKLEELNVVEVNIGNKRLKK